MQIFTNHYLWREFLGFCGERQPTAELAFRFVHLIAGDTSAPDEAACANSARLVLQSRLASTAFFFGRRSQEAARR